MVADKRTSGLRHFGRDVGRCQRLQHGLDGQGAEVSRRARLGDRQVYRLRARIVCNTRILNIDGNALQRQAGSATRQPQAQYQRGLVLAQQGGETFARGCKLCGQLRSHHAVAVQGLAMQGLRYQPTGVDGLAAKGIKACQQHGCGSGIRRDVFHMFCNVLVWQKTNIHSQQLHGSRYEMGRQSRIRQR